MIIQIPYLEGWMGSDSSGLTGPQPVCIGSWGVSEKRRPVINRKEYLSLFLPGNQAGDSLGPTKIFQSVQVLLEEGLLTRLPDEGTGQTNADFLLQQSHRQWIHNVQSSPLEIMS